MTLRVRLTAAALIALFLSSPLLLPAGAEAPQAQPTPQSAQASAIEAAEAAKAAAAQEAARIDEEEGEEGQEESYDPPADDEE